MAIAPTFPAPQSGASLLLSFTPPPSTVKPTFLLISATRLSSLRAFAALEAGYDVVVATSGAETWDEELASRLEAGQVSKVPLEVGFEADEASWGNWLDSLPTEIQRTCSLVALNDTFPTASPRRSFTSARAFRKAASSRRYLINVADAPTLSDFTWPTTHRFLLDSSSTPSTSRAAPTTKSSLQLAVTTNSSACRLAARIKREVVASLPSNIGASVNAVSELRRQLKGESERFDGGEEEEMTAGVAFNRPVEQLSRQKSEQLGSVGSGAQSPSVASVDTWTAVEAQRTRMRYVAQISEYWPLDRLASATLSTLSAPSTPVSTSPASSSPTQPSQHSLLIAPPPRKGRIILLGTGPGSPLLLTRLAHLFLTSPPGSPYHVDTFLTDKLVPSEILALIPSPAREKVVIAKKYPGNAEHAQDELMRLAVEAANEGKTVLRMKQGDPFLYGRGGEEVLHFRLAGFEPLVVPGLSSCLAGPALAGIPVTQRGVAESVVVCTGVGRGGRNVLVDGYSRSRTLCVLMGVARLQNLVDSLIQHPESPFPPYLPIALVERASSPDQRVVMSTIEALPGVLERLPPHRPPGMLVIGWGVMCLQGTEGKGDMTVLDVTGEEEDRARVEGWLGPEGYRVTEGLGECWRSFVDRVAVS